MLRYPSVIGSEQGRQRNGRDMDHSSGGSRAGGCASAKTVSYGVLESYERIQISIGPLLATKLPD
jgi:hypothetical protein